MDQNMASQDTSFLEDVDRLRGTTFKNEEERIKARVAVSKLLAELESPWEKVHRLAWMEVWMA
jgi:hypothetical protein